MTDQSPDSIFLKIVGPAIGSVVGAALGWLTGGSDHVPAALTTGLAVVGGISALAFSIMYQRFLGVLASGGVRRGSPARADYDALRESLSGENVAMRFYIKLLRAFLEWIERFFGDVGMADRTLFPHAFGLRTQAPLWTATAFDRCLLLALIYPVATILLIWTISGHVGPGESALGLQAGTSGWRRAAATALVFFCSYAVRQTMQFQTINPFWAYVVGLVAIAIAVAGPGGAGAVTVAGILAAGASAAGSALVVASAVAGVGTIAVAIAVANDSASPRDLDPIGFVAIAVAYVFYLAVQFIDNLAITRQHYGIFLAVFVATMISLCLGLPVIVASSAAWKYAGPLLLFMGLLTFLNAPFDWASLGLTRVLLRRGLELGAWWPYFFALIDASLAAVIITLLAVTMVVGVQVFDAVAVHSGGMPVLPLNQLFDGLATHPNDPEYWWIYALLISSMIPSMLNLAIGGVAFVRGVPVLRSVLLGFLYEGKAVAPHNRAWIALVLTVQTFVGIFLGVAAQAFLAIGIIGYVLPWLGLHILDVARDIADFNLPERVWALIIS